MSERDQTGEMTPGNALSPRKTPVPGSGRSAECQVRSKKFLQKVEKMMLSGYLRTEELDEDNSTCIRRGLTRRSECTMIRLNLVGSSGDESLTMSGEESLYLPF